MNITRRLSAQGQFSQGGQRGQRVEEIIGQRCEVVEFQFPAGVSALVQIDRGRRLAGF